LPAPGFALAALKGLSRLAPHLHVLKLRNADFSRDPSIVAAMSRDPLIAGESETAQTTAELTRAGGDLRTKFQRLTLPLLILHGTADKVAKASGSQFLYVTAGAKDKALKLYDGAFHDLLNDTVREAVMTDIGNWLDDRLSKWLGLDSVSVVPARS
jgi:alpha-beta hydrolase superfamily lysophospholipase